MEERNKLYLFKYIIIIYLTISCTSNTEVVIDLDLMTNVDCDVYNSHVLVTKVINSSLKVKNGDVLLLVDEKYKHIKTKLQTQGYRRARVNGYLIRKKQSDFTDFGCTDAKMFVVIKVSKS